MTIAAMGVTGATLIVAGMRFLSAASVRFWQLA